MKGSVALALVASLGLGVPAAGTAEEACAAERAATESSALLQWGPMSHGSISRSNVIEAKENDSIVEEEEEEETGSVEPERLEDAKVSMEDVAHPKSNEAYWVSDALPVNASALPLGGYTQPSGHGWLIKISIALWQNDPFMLLSNSTQTPSSGAPKEAALADWLFLFGVVVVFMAIDAFVLQRYMDASEKEEQFAGSFGHKPALKLQGDIAVDVFLRMQPFAMSRDAGALEANSATQEQDRTRDAKRQTKLQGSNATEASRGTCSGSSASAQATTGPGTRSYSKTLFILAFWVLAAGVYNIFVAYRQGWAAGVKWCSGYILEWLLSVDNLFVFHLIFRNFRAPPPSLHRALFIGILCAAAFRLCFFMAISIVPHLVQWIRVFFGILLIYSGVQTMWDDGDKPDVENIMAVRALKRCLGSRLSDGYDMKGHFFFRREDGRLCATLLVAVVVCLEITDALFAIDSVCAKVAQFPDQYIGYSSSIIALFGLRGAFFIITDLIDTFQLLKYGLCIILVFIGIELIISKWVILPPHVVCVVIFSVFIVSIGSSLVQGLCGSEVEAAALQQAAMGRRRLRCHRGAAKAPQSSAALAE